MPLDDGVFSKLASAWEIRLFVSNAIVSKQAFQDYTSKNKAVEIGQSNYKKGNNKINYIEEEHDFSCKPYLLT